MKLDYLKILRTLRNHEVDFIIVGGVCGVLHGAPISTFDLDIVHSRTEDNVRRLLAALAELDARYRDPAGRIIRPKASYLAAAGHHLFMTNVGPLDVLGIIGKQRGFEELLNSTVMLQLSVDCTILLLDLETLILTKEETARDKDRAVLSILRKTLDEKGKMADLG